MTESLPSPDDLSQVDNQPPQRKRRRFLPVFNFVLILSLAGVTGYGWWQLQSDAPSSQELEELSSAVSESNLQYKVLATELTKLRETQSDDLNHDLEELVGTKFEITEENSQRLSRIENHFQDLRSQVQTIAQTSSTLSRQTDITSNYDDLLYLANLANRQLHHWMDSASAIESLEELDRTISTVADDSLAEVQQSVRNVLQQVRNTEDLSGSELLRRIDDLYEELHSLPFRQSVAQFATVQVNSDRSETPIEETSFWERLANNSLSLVRVRTDASINTRPQLTEEHFQSAYLRMEQRLAQIPQAVLRRDQNLYQSSIDSLLDIGDKSLEQGDPAVVSFIDELKTMRTQDVDPVFPAMDEVRKGLTAFVEVKTRASFENVSSIQDTESPTTDTVLPRD